MTRSGVAAATIRRTRSSISDRPVVDSSILAVMAISLIIRESSNRLSTNRFVLAVDAPDAAWAELLPLTEEEQIQELERRLAEHEQDPDSAVPWEEVQALRTRFE